MHRGRRQGGGRPDPRDGDGERRRHNGREEETPREKRRAKRRGEREERGVGKRSVGKRGETERKARKTERKEGRAAPAAASVKEKSLKKSENKGEGACLLARWPCHWRSVR